MRPIGCERSMWPLSDSTFLPSMRIWTFLTSGNSVKVSTTEPTSIVSPVEPPTKSLRRSPVKSTVAVPFSTLTLRSLACFGMMFVWPFSFVPSRSDYIAAVYFSCPSSVTVRLSAMSFMPCSSG